MVKFEAQPSPSYKAWEVVMLDGRYATWLADLETKEEAEELVRFLDELMTHVAIELLDRLGFPVK
jgi:hypothetical protein